MYQPAMKSRLLVIPVNREEEDVTWLSGFF